MMRRAWPAIVFAALSIVQVGADDSLEKDWKNPPPQARLRAYWWWLNSNVTRESITRDLEWMKSIGMGGGLVFDAGGATQGGHAQVPAGPIFGSPAWRELFKHALVEADRLGLAIGMNIQSGWNLGGPMVTPEKAAKIISWSQVQVQGPTNLLVLPPPKSHGRYYCDSLVVAYRTKPDCTRKRPIRLLEQKSAFRELGMNAADCSGLLFDDPPEAGEESIPAAAVVNLTGRPDKDGRLACDLPAGDWTVLRFGYTCSGARVSTCTPGWDGLALDYLDADALRWYWHEVIDPIIADAGTLAGKSWKMVQTDSWEMGGMNWTAGFPGEFRKRRGYDIAPWMPVLSGCIVEGRDASSRFLADFRRTIADCVADNHYGVMAELAHRHGLGIQPESAGPHTAPLDGLKNYGRSDWPMSEFWVPSPHRPTDEARFFVKQASSAAHIYGKSVVCAEGFTSIGPQWDEVLWKMQKPSFDHEACAGLNLVFWHTFTCSPKEMGIPGQEYFAGSHFNPQITWAKQAPAFVAYLNRCQAMLQRGEFVADVLYYYGNHVPNFARLKKDDPAGVLPKYDYDVINEEALLERLTVKDGRLLIPGGAGMRYRILVLPKTRVLSLEAARKIRELVKAGAVVVGPKPVRPTGLQDDVEFKGIVDELWNGAVGVADKTALETLAGLDVEPDVEGVQDWIHRRDGDIDIYFISNQKAEPVSVDCVFRVSGKTPELWDPVTGECRSVPCFRDAGGKSKRTALPLEFGPYGSVFVVFRSPAGNGRPIRMGNYPTFSKLGELNGPWTVRFDPKWGGPESVEFAELANWTDRPEEGIRWYSGTATYRKMFDLPVGAGASNSMQRLWLDLGRVSDVAEVRLNGKALGVVWSPPFRVDIGSAVKGKGNALEIDVVNGWHNRLALDLTLPEKQRLTKTNIRLRGKAAPRDSGLLGPVTIMRSDMK